MNGISFRYPGNRGGHAQFQRSHRRSRSSFEPRHGEAPASQHVVRKPSPATGRQAEVKSQHTGTSQRYEPGSLPSRPSPQRLTTIGAGLCAADASELVTACDRLSRRDLRAVASPLAPATARLACCLGSSRARSVPWARTSSRQNSEFPTSVPMYKNTARRGGMLSRGIEADVMYAGLAKRSFAAYSAVRVGRAMWRTGAGNAPRDRQQRCKCLGHRPDRDSRPASARRL
jgi:hypothetical protein